LALAILPCLVGDCDPELARVLGPEEVFSRELWLLVHPDLQHAARVRALLDAVAAHVAREAERIAGRGPVLTPGAPSR
jgi:DNA-binding transcriptional LysR family regulator